MKRFKVAAISMLTLLGLSANSQVITEDTTGAAMNTAQNIIAGNYGKQVVISGYGQIDYNQGLGNARYHTGNLDIHRLIMFFGYRFNNKTQFVTEIEWEHVKEVYIEQAFINHNINNWLNLRGGLLLIPMGIVNEYHESTTFNGVERPNLDKYIVPSTWRELGFGATGQINSLSLRYQLYVVNGPKSFDGNGPTLSGKYGIRKGRQKGAESFVSSPSLSTKIDFFGVKGLKMGAAAFIGNTQTTAYDGLQRADAEAGKRADSTAVGLSMFGVDYRYKYKRFESRGELIYASLTNTKAYNTYFGTDVGSSMFGYFVEAGYDVLPFFTKTEQKLVLFGRYETYDTQYTVSDENFKNKAYARTDITVGFSYHLVPNGTVFKVDYQNFTTQANNDQRHQLNIGIGYWF
ncbi:MAG TPA: hypothetical protein DIU39_10045 [Flavobacteriales bacterium]|nr:hypothetical protein [Flavobacteriales bacterium]